MTPTAVREAVSRLRLRLAIRGAVQGVGFRPFVYRLAREMGLPGWVNNSAQGVFIEVEGMQPVLDDFLLRLEREKPAHALIHSLEPALLDPVGFTTFEIRASENGDDKTAFILPDIATCPECRREIFDPANRRYRYPFTNCTHCGPRFSLIEALPYDRPNTTMKGFAMCAACRAEYDDPLDRRFHAQPIACPQCGPHLELWDGEGQSLALRDSALLAAADAIRSGAIVAVKGLGGFHLMADARCEASVQRLRQRKRREEKPFALMFPSLEMAKAQCQISELEERLLLSPAAPIVLLRQSQPPLLAPAVAPGNPYLGVMLPYTPLHHLLMAELGFPVVATSGNLSDEPICTDEREALERLGGLADLFLVHDRPIARHVDDSVARVVAGRELILRRARGYAPLPITLPSATHALAVGAHLKNTVALSADRQAFISQHIGDLEGAPAYDAFQRVIADFERLYAARPAAIACDLHPDYLSTRYAQQRGLPLIGVQHHFAHVLACLAENKLEGPVLGVAWDGTGFGTDGVIWGGEFLRVDGGTFTRAAHLRPFRLPGGEKAIREPKRTALALLFELFGDAIATRTDLPPVQACSAQQREFFVTMLRKGLNAPLTTSAGRLFDGVAALIGLRQSVRFEGQAAMELEFALDGIETDAAYPFTLEQCGGALVVDWAALVEGILDDLRAEVGPGEISARFHNTLAEIIVDVAQRVGLERVALTGGCFQNKYLTERAVARLRQAGFRPYWHQRVPPNDGGIALGQLVAASRSKE